MVIKDEKKIKVNYVIVKIDGKIYSTKFGSKAHESGCEGTTKKAITKNIGNEKYIRIRYGKFVETNGHKKIEPKEFEIDIYLEDENNSN